MHSATTTGIHALRMLILAVRAILNMGAAISAATAGRIPWNILSTVGFSLNWRKNTAIVSMIINEGRAAPSAHIRAPGRRRIL